jgi:hypothetical protein
MRVMLVSLALFASACTGPGCASSTPSAQSLEEGYVGPVVLGNGDGGNNM